MKKKRIRGILAFVVCAGMLFSVTACSDKDYRELFLGKNVQSEEETGNEEQPVQETESVAEGKKDKESEEPEASSEPQMKWLCVYEEKRSVEGELYSSCERTYNDFGQVLEEKFHNWQGDIKNSHYNYNENQVCLLYTTPSQRDKRQSRMPSSA